MIFNYYFEESEQNYEYIKVSKQHTKYVMMILKYVYPDELKIHYYIKQ